MSKRDAKLAFEVDGRTDAELAQGDLIAYYSDLVAS